MPFDSLLRSDTIDFVTEELERPITCFEMDLFFRLILRRSVDSVAFFEALKSQGVTREGFVHFLLSSPEFFELFPSINRVNDHIAKHRLDDHRYRIPDDLRVGATDKAVKVLLIGSCLMVPWQKILSTGYPGSEFELMHMYNASALPDLDKSEIDTYNFQIVQVAMRAILPEATYFGLHVRDQAAYRKLFDLARQRLDTNLEAILKFNKRYGIVSFVLGLLPPQQNPLGRLQPRYDISNMVYFVEQLNSHIYDKIQAMSNVYYIDFEQIVATYGKKYFQDDSATHLNHGSAIGGMTLAGDENRLEAPGDVTMIFTPCIEKVVTAAYAECLGHARSLQQEDSIKLIIFDLDDTLWRGVAAEEPFPGQHMIEGWPLGMLEALSYLWRRGILLAITSKNDIHVAKSIWDELYGKTFPMSNFVATEINWNPKAENIEKIMKEINILPGNVLFVDDNPVERAAVRAAFPEIRTIETPLLTWRRILLWAPELQRASITDEAASRTAMVQAQIERETIRAAMDHEGFLQSLQTETHAFVIRSATDPLNARAFELLNKTNQFNTTGRRWSATEMVEFFSNDGHLIAVDVKDKFANYGIAALLLVEQGTILQFVMSCRVFGMGVEFSALNLATEYIRAQGYADIVARVRATEKNVLSTGIYKQAGFVEKQHGTWVLCAA